MTQDRGIPCHETNNSTGCAQGTVTLLVPLGNWTAPAVPMPDADCDPLPFETSLTEKLMSLLSTFSISCLSITRFPDLVFPRVRRGAEPSA